MSLMQWLRGKLFKSAPQAQLTYAVYDRRACCHCGKIVAHYANGKAHGKHKCQSAARHGVANASA
jgi:hypothetical protein